MSLSAPQKLATYDVEAVNQQLPQQSVVVQEEEKKESKNDDKEMDKKTIKLYENVFDPKYDTEHIDWNELYHLCVNKGRILFVNNIINKHYSQYLKDYDHSQNSLPIIPNLSDKILKFIQDTISESEMVIKSHNLLHSHNDWTTQVDNYDNISVYYRPYNENAIHSLKVSFTSKCHPLHLLAVINEFDLLKEIVTVIPLETKYLKEFTNLNKVIYEKISLWWPLYNRDLICHVHGYDLLNEYGEILIWGKSFDEIEGVEIPEIETKTVRVEVVMGHGVIKPKLNENNELISEIISVYCINSKSMLPKALINWLTRTFAYYACKMIRDTTENLKGTTHFQRMKEKDIYKEWQREFNQWRDKQIQQKHLQT